MTADTRYWPTLLLCRFNGANNSTTMVNEAPLPWRDGLSAAGNARLSTAQSKFGGASLYLAGSTTADRVSAPAGANWIGNGKRFMLECQLFMNAYNVNGGRIASLCSASAAWQASGGIHWLLQNTASGIQFAWWNGTTYGSLLGTLALSSWTHVKVYYSGASVYLFIDGALISSAATTMANSSGTPTFCIGAIYGETSSAQAYSGYIDQLQISYGADMDTANFTPPVSEYVPSVPLPESATTPALSQTIGAFVVARANTTTAASLGTALCAPQASLRGVGRISGTVKEKTSPVNTPLARRVVLHSHTSAQMVDQTWSDASTGAYTFNGVSTKDTYYVVSFDHTGAYRGVIADHQTPELMA